MPERRLAAVLLGAALLPGLASFAAAPVPDGVDRAEYELAARTILCDCGCHPQSVYDCTCGRAAEMRDEVAAEIRSGKTGQQVIDAYVARYGEQIRIAPTATGFNLVAWLGPALALVATTALMFLLLRRWRRAASGGTDEAVGPAAEPGDERYRTRIAEALKEYDA